MEMIHRRFNFYRWYRHVQCEVRCRKGFLCVGWIWRHASRPVIYWSPDATPAHERVHGLFLRHMKAL